MVSADVDDDDDDDEELPPTSARARVPDSARRMGKVPFLLRDVGSAVVGQRMAGPPTGRRHVGADWCRAGGNAPGGDEAMGVRW
jgi:hypothetical protein